METNGAQAIRPSKGPEIVAPTNRVTVAFPFSKIVLQEPGEELAQLASIVADLAGVVEGLAPGPATAALRRRAVSVLPRGDGAES